PVMDDREKSRSSLGERSVDVRDTTVRNRALNRDGMDHAINRMVGGIPRLPRDLDSSILSADRCADGASHDGIPCWDRAAWLSARTIARLASSILYALCRRGTASRSAIWAARRNVASPAAAPMRTCSAST